MYSPSGNFSFRQGRRVNTLTFVPGASPGFPNFSRVIQIEVPEFSYQIKEPKFPIVAGV